MQTYGLLTIKKDLGMVNGRHSVLCQCKCGNETTALESELRRGRKKSCGCLKRGKRKGQKRKKTAAQLEAEHVRALAEIAVAKMPRERIEHELVNFRCKTFRNISPRTAAALDKSMTENTVLRRTLIKITKCRDIGLAIAEALAVLDAGRNFSTERRARQSSEEAVHA